MAYVIQWKEREPYDTPWKHWATMPNEMDLRDIENDCDQLRAMHANRLFRIDVREQLWCYEREALGKPEGCEALQAITVERDRYRDALAGMVAAYSTGIFTDKAMADAVEALRVLA